MLKEETHSLTKVVFDTINGHLAVKGLLLKEGTIVDATIIAAPPSTKNKTGEREPDMHQTKKGNEWYICMKAHIGVDADSGLVHTVVTTAANVNDVTQCHALLHGEETHAFGDAGYTGVTRWEDNQAGTVTWHGAMKPGKHCVLSDTPLGQVLEKSEHPFHGEKNLFRHCKTRYRGLAKNTAQLLTLFAMANLMVPKKRLIAITPKVRPE